MSRVVEMVGGPEDGARFEIPDMGQFIDVALPPAGVAFGIQPTGRQRIARLAVERRKTKSVFVWANRVERDQ